MTLVSAQPPIRPKKAEAIPGPIDALSMALADCQSLPEAEQVFARYIWIGDGSRESGQAVSLVLNMLSRGSRIVRPVPIGVGKLLLMRVDMRWYAPRTADLAEWGKAWEELRNEPRFNLLVTKGILSTLRNLHGLDVLSVEREFDESVSDSWPGGRDATGRFFPKGTPYQWKRKVRKTVAVPLAELSGTDLARVPAPSMAKQLAELAVLTGSEAPVVTDRYFLFRGLNTIKEKGLYSQLYGGIYYEFTGTKTGAQQGTDEDAIFEALGVGNVKAGITAAKVFETLRSDQRVAVFRSGVTGQPRRIDFLPSLSGRIDTSSRLVTVTHDLEVKDIDIDTHPVAQLLNFTDTAREGIAEKANGLHLYWLTNGEGKLQEKAPIEVVHDSTIPPPHRPILQGAVTCISCHEALGDDGYKPVSNDVLKLLRSRGVGVFGPELAKTKDQQDTFDRLASLYSGQPERALQKARDDYAAAVLRATGPWKESPDQKDVVKLAGSRIIALHRGYYLDLVGAKQMLTELGVAPGADPVRKFNQMIPAEAVEDVRVSALRAGLEISRPDADLIFGFLLAKMKRAVP